MKILHYTWNSYIEKDVFSIYNDLSIEYDRFSWIFQNKNEDEEFYQYFLSSFDATKYCCVFSINYWPMLSKVCQTLNLLYICWCYDAPLDVRNIEETLGNDNNRVYLFDRNQYYAYKCHGFDTVYHLPLGVNSKRLSKINSDSPKCIPYRCDVSFVGQLYVTPINEIINLCNDYIKGYLTSLINTQQRVYGEFLIDKVLTDDLLNQINKNISEGQYNLPIISKQELSFAIASEITRRDRLLILSLCGLHYNTHLFSNSHSDLLSNVKQHLPIDYYSEMPYIFAGSKINLNPSLRAIQTGIPLRALDVMACGGFLLSNYQEEFLDYYEIDNDIILYDSMEDAIEKIGYYIKHDEARISIQSKAREKTLTEFNMKNRIQYMLNQNIEY